MKCHILLLFLLLPFLGQAKDDPDYWSDDFDENKNCVREQEMMELQREQEPGRCSWSTAGKKNRNYIAKVVTTMSLQ